MNDRGVAHISDTSYRKSPLRVRRQTQMDVQNPEEMFNAVKMARDLLLFCLNIEKRLSSSM